MSSKKPAARRSGISDNQLQSIMRTLQIAAFGLIVILGVRFIARDLIAPLLLAIFLSALMSPLFSFFRRRGAGGILSLILVILTVIVSLLGVILFFTWSYQLVIEYLSVAIIDFKTSLVTTVSGVGYNPVALRPLTDLLTPDLIFNLIQKITQSIGSGVLYFFIVPILSLLILLQVDSIPEDVKEASLKDNRILNRMAIFSRTVTSYIVGRFKVNLITALLATFAYLLLGIPFPFVWGILTLVLAFVPFVGLIIAGAIPAMIGFADSGFVGMGLVIGSLLLITMITENIFEPMIQGKRHKLTAATLITAFIFWSWLLGPIGAILTAPLTVLLKLVLGDYTETAWISSLMEGNYAQAKKQAKGKRRLSRVLDLFSGKRKKKA